MKKIASFVAGPALALTMFAQSASGLEAINNETGERMPLPTVDLNEANLPACPVIPNVDDLEPCSPAKTQCQLMNAFTDSYREMPDALAEARDSVVAEFNALIDEFEAETGVDCSVVPPLVPPMPQ
jgi:hypothetical protein